MYSTFSPDEPRMLGTAAFVETVPLNMGGRIWTLRFSALPSLGVDRSRSFIVLGGGVLVSFLLSAIAWFLAKNRMQAAAANQRLQLDIRSEEHTSELQSLMRISYAVFGLKKKRNTDNNEPIICTRQ